MKNYSEEYISNRLGIVKPVLMLESAEIQDSSIKCSYDIGNSNAFIKCHFINNPVMPGTYLLEMLAQSGALLEMELLESDSVPIIVSITGVRFLREVRENQKLISEVEIKDIRNNYYITRGKIRCNGDLVCKAEIVHVVSVGD